MNRFYILLIALLSVVGICAQEDYNRSSLYIIPLLHPGTGMYNDIYATSLGLTIPDRYNDHSLGMRLLAENQNKLSTMDEVMRLQRFLIKNQIAKRLVAKWFCRNKETGAFSMRLVGDRGMYNASTADIEMAMNTIRGEAILADAGEQLIDQTFVIFNDITYYNKEEKAQTALGIFSIIAQAAAAVVGVSGAIGGQGGQIASGVANMTKSLSELGGTVANQIAGFKVDIHSYLFRLHWDEETAARFYNDYWFTADQPDSAKKAAFEADTKTFYLEYVGDYSARSSKTVMRGLHTPADVFHKVLTRATDKNIVELQHLFPVFKVTASVYDIQDGMVRAAIGLKEGVNAKSKYEVLERSIDEQGRISYHRRAMLSPDKAHIWDNRCMASEEEAENADLHYTSFRITQGSAANLYPGMLIREVR